MVARKKGIIVNIASLSAIVPANLLSVYSATKAFADKFSEDLQGEYEKDGIIVQSVLPGFVATNMTKMKRGSFMAPLPSKYVESAIRTIGYAGHTVGYLPHTILQFSAQLASYIVPSISRSVTAKTMLNVRNRQVKKGQYVPVEN